MSKLATAEHILSWCENSQKHWCKLKEVSTPGNFIRAQGQATAALDLAIEVVTAMVAAGDLSRMSLEAADILDAAKLFIEWKAEP